MPDGTDNQMGLGVESSTDGQVIRIEIWGSLKTK